MLAEIKNGRLKLMAETDEEKQEMRRFYNRFFPSTPAAGLDVEVAMSDDAEEDCFLFLRHAKQVN